MSLYHRDRFAAEIAALPGTATVAQWGSLVAKVGGKVFCLLSDTGDAIVFKVSETSYAGLITCAGVSQAAYFAKGQWVSVAPDALDEPSLAAYLAEAHRLIAAKLTRKLRTELGL